LLCIFALISALPLYSNAKNPDLGLAEKPQLFFSSPQILSLLLRKAIHEHPQVKSQVQAMQIAGLEVLIAQQAYWPTPSVSMERVQTQLPDPSYAGSPQILTFRLQQPLWTGGRLTAQSNKALANQEIESARFAEVQQALALKTLQAWGEVNSAKRQQWTLSRSHEVQTQLQKKIERRFDQGLSARSEVAYSSLRLSQILQDLKHAQQQESHAWIHLKQWVPDAQMQWMQLESQLDHTPVKSVAALATELTKNELPQWESLSIARSPTMLRLAGILQVQLAELQEKRASLQPEVYLRAEHQRGNYAYSGLPPVNRIFVGLTASTGAGLSLSHQLTALENKREGTQQDIAATQRTVIEAIQADYVNVFARQSKATALRFNLDSAQELQAAWERQFINGKKTWIDVMNAARETTQAELAVIENDMAFLQSYWRLQIHAYGALRWAAP
jgi:adhesin transport system outer membrane protein